MSDPLLDVAGTLVKNFNQFIGLLEGRAGGCGICTEGHSTLQHPPPPPKQRVQTGELGNVINDAIDEWVAANPGESLHDPNNSKMLARFIRDRLAGR